MQPTTQAPFTQEYAASTLSAMLFDVLFYADNEKSVILIKQVAKDFDVQEEQIADAVRSLVEKGMAEYVGNQQSMYRMTPYGKKVLEFDESTAKTVGHTLALIERPT